MRPLHVPMLAVFLLSAPLVAQMSATVDRDTVRLWDANFEFGCLASFFPIVSVSRDTVYLAEVDTAFHAPCRCHYTICTTLTGLAPGDYTAIITREQRHYYTPDSVSISVRDSGVVHFTVMTSSPPSISFWQSKCLEQTVVSGGGSSVPSPSMRIHPNPFNPATSISFSLDRPASVRLRVYSLAGHLVACLIDRDLDSGSHRVAFDGRAYASGTYVCRLEAGPQVVSERMILIK